jgi:hypothetical protein
MTATLQSQASPAGFSMGRVLGEATAIYGRRFWAIALIVLVFMSGPSLVLQLLGIPLSMYRRSPGDLPRYAAAMAGVYVVRWIASGAIAKFGLEVASRRTTLLGSVGASLRAFPALLPLRVSTEGPALGLLLWIQLSHGSAFQITALTSLASFAIWIFYLALSPFIGVVTPVVLTEGAGPISSLARSFELLSLGRLPFAVLYFIMHLAFSVSGFVLQMMLVGSFRMLGFVSVAYVIESAGFGFLILVFYGAWSVMTSVSYRELCRVRGGGSPEHVADVFA